MVGARVYSVEQRRSLVFEDARMRGQCFLLLSVAWGLRSMPRTEAPTRRRRRTENPQMAQAMSLLFQEKLLDKSEELLLGRVAQDLLRIESLRSSLLDEREAEYAPSTRSRQLLWGRRGLKRPDLALEAARDEYSRRDAFRSEWALRANCSSVADMDGKIEAGRAARQALVSANMRLVYSLAKRHEGHGVALSDLIQEGAIGLMSAATKFDPDRGYKFSTYAYHWIRQALLRALACKSRLIRLPMYVHDEIVRLTRCKRAFERDYGRDPSDDELCDELRISMEKLKRTTDAMKVTRLVSIDAPLENVDGQRGAYNAFDDASGGGHQHAVSHRRSAKVTFVGDVLPALDKPDSSAAVELSLLHAAIREVLDGLTPDEAFVITRRFGLDDGVQRSAAQIARHSHLSMPEAKSLELTALRKLRTPRSLRLLEPFNDQRNVLLSCATYS